MYNALCITSEVLTVTENHQTSTYMSIRPVMIANIYKVHNFWKWYSAWIIWLVFPTDLPTATQILILFLWIHFCTMWFPQVNAKMSVKLLNKKVFKLQFDILMDGVQNLRAWWNFFEGFVTVFQEFSHCRLDCFMKFLESISSIYQKNIT